MNFFSTAACFEIRTVFLYYTNFCLPLELNNKKATFNKSSHQHNLATKPQFTTKDFTAQKNPRKPTTAASLMSSFIGQHWSMQQEATDHMI